MEAVPVQEILTKLPANMQKQLQKLAEVFIAENLNLNLSAHRTKDRVWIGNILDSLAAVICIKECSNTESPMSILDLGTGGGFPLLPLAITFPHHRFTGLDSVKKKMDAVQRIVDALSIANVSLVTGRAEELGNNAKHREVYDIVTAKAVAETRLLLEYCAPFVKVGGHILLWKSMNIDDEISSANRAETELNLQRKSSISYELGGDWGQRQILVYEKTKATSKEYPRPVGSAKKSPL